MRKKDHHQSNSYPDSEISSILLEDENTGNKLELKKESYEEIIIDDFEDGSLDSIKSKSTVYDRLNHNDLEKKRRAHIRLCFDKLKHLVPVGSDINKHTTLGLLTKSKHCIQILQKKEKKYTAFKEQLRKEQKHLKRKLEQLQLLNCGTFGYGQRIPSSENSLREQKYLKEKSEQLQGSNGETTNFTYGILTPGNASGGFNSSTSTFVFNFNYPLPPILKRKVEYFLNKNNVLIQQSTDLILPDSYLNYSQYSSSMTPVLPETSSAVIYANENVCFIDDNMNYMAPHEYGLQPDDGSNNLSSISVEGR